MEGTLTDGVVRVGGDARQRFYDSSGYGRPLDGNEIELAPVEAAHLLSRGDLDAVDDMGFREFLRETGAVLEFVVYKDFRDRGFYLSPARDEWVQADVSGRTGVTLDDLDFVVYPRGKGPEDGEVLYRVRVLSEREAVQAANLGDVVLAIVDEDGELTFLETDRPTVTGDAAYDLPVDVDATLHEDRVIVWTPPADLYERGFYGQYLHGRNAETGPLQLSLVEAAYLAEHDAIDLDPGGIRKRGRDVEGERFSRRHQVYGALREAGTVPKSGFKFGADFRTYDRFDTVADLSHSDRLIRVVTADHEFIPRDLSLDVRLAGGVRKRMVFALTDANGNIDWLSVARLTP